MKRVLLVHFSQTGQLTRLARRLSSPLTGAGDVELVEEVLRPRRPYPFPWPAWRFLDAMPETVLLEPPVLEPFAAGACSITSCTPTRAERSRPSSRRRAGS